jgi:hypothetical protein
VVIDLEFSEDMQAFVNENEEEESFFQKDTNAPKKNPGMIIVYDTTEDSVASLPSIQEPASMPSSTETQSGESTPLPGNAPVINSGATLSRMREMREQRTSARNAQISSQSTITNRKPRRARRVVTMRLVSDDGIVHFPRYHFGSGSTRMVLDERRFRPGFYTLEAESTNVRTGARETVSQSFAWGVLAMNTDKDRYHPGETGEIHIGALDARGEIICDADLTLAITDPAGDKTVLRTRNRTIEITGTCGVKQGGLLSPDYRAGYVFEQEGTYILKLESVTGSHTATIDSVISVRARHPLRITRKAATRLWPFAPSTMDITVEFSDAFSGRLRETVPKGFILSASQPEALLTTDPSSGDLTLLWQGTWSAGAQVHLSYTYDAPDISPEFYLLGPLLFSPWIESGSQISLDEMRSWQIANDSASASTTYDITKDAVVAGGGEITLSSNYQLSDTIGEPGAGIVSSTNYTLEGGYRSADENFASLDCWNTLDLGTIPGIGQATGEANCIVIADAPSGYTLMASHHGVRRDSNWLYDQPI